MKIFAIVIALAPDWRFIANIPAVDLEAALAKAHTYGEVIEVI